MGQMFESSRCVGCINFQGFVVGVHRVDKTGPKSMGRAHDRPQITGLGNSLHPNAKIPAHL